MSNYRRLISYIYAYEGGKKGKNVGYAKIEVRSGRCKIHVNVKSIYVGSSDIGVYLLAPGKEIMLGKIFVRNGLGEFRANTAADNIENSGISSDQCYGLTIHDVDSTWQCYTTIWDDAVSQSAEIQLAHVTSQNVREKTQTNEVPRPSVADEIARELEEEEKKLANVAPWDGSQQTGKVTVPAAPAAANADQMPSVARTAEAPRAAGAAETAEAARTAEAIEAAEIVTAAELVAGTDDETVQKIDQGEADEVNVPAPGDPQQLEELDRMEQEESNNLPVWDQMARRYIKIFAFDYDNGCEILSIKPQDIGLLPREIWIYGNNSFLLHGYYNYRHLILAKLNNPNGKPRYLLGVPGHYFSNEKYMASMFGFPHFVLAKKQPEEDGRFGYWYTDIKL